MNKMADVEWLAAKLEPLMPSLVGQWLRARQTADSELRNLIDQKIVAEARRHFGEPDKRILLSLPPEKTIRGSLNLGNVVYDRQRWPAGVRASELLQNLGIFGRSGSGKTNLILHLLLQLEAQGIPWLFLDWKRTARQLIPQFQKPVQVFTPGRDLAPFAFNPFAPPMGLESRVYFSHVMDVLAKAYTLGEGARRMLQKSLEACLLKGITVPTINELLAELEILADKGRSKGWKQSAQRALESLSFAQAVADQTDPQQMAQSFFLGNTIIELDALPQAAREFLVPLLLLWIFQTKLGQPHREQLDLAIVVEEAHHVLYRQERRARESLVNTILRQSREIGIGHFIVDQHPHLISSAALGNCFTTVCMNLKDPADVQRAAGLSLVGQNERQFFGQLHVGQGIVKLQDRWTRPFLVRIPLVPHDKGAMTDQRLRVYLEKQARGTAGRAADSPAHRPQGVPSGQVPRIPVWDDPLEEGMLTFLDNVLDHPHDGVRVRYQRLAMSARQGHRIQQYLLRRGWLEGEVIPLGHTRKLVFRLTNAAREALGIIDTSQGHTRESIAHAYWKHFYANWLIEQGYEVKVEALRHQGRIDVLGERAGKTIAVEIETGKSDIAENVRQCLRFKIHLVLVVATTRDALQKVERILAQTGLMVSRRLQIIQAGKLPQEIASREII
jgi:hypothetical protein